MGIDLSFQKFEDELNGLPGYYALPTGCLFLAFLGSGEISQSSRRFDGRSQKLQDDLDPNGLSHSSRMIDGKRDVLVNEESSTVEVLISSGTRQGINGRRDDLVNEHNSTTANVVMERVAEGMPVGCVALRPLPLTRREDGGISRELRVYEMKRLYCVPTSRGLGVGRLLVEEVIREAERLGYEEMRLDTLPQMEGARKLYREWGFVECERYYETPLEGTIFLSKRLGLKS